MGLLSGDLAIEQRAAIINRFRDGKEKVLITTNVTARGESKYRSMVQDIRYTVQLRTPKSYTNQNF